MLKENKHYAENYNSHIPLIALQSLHNYQCGNINHTRPKTKFKTVKITEKKNLLHLYFSVLFKHFFNLCGVQK